ncbi:MAG: hypothetical protein K8H74_08735 [Notoacmeibacter sp.]|nr:hypothetical protein [Notoacmeibacter sp.]
MIRESQPRLVTGEILTADRGRPDIGGPDRSGDFEDAVFETVMPGASTSGTVREPHGSGRTSPSRPRLEADADATSLSVLRSTGNGAGASLVHHFREAGGPLFWSTALVLIASAFWISGGYALLARSGGETPGQALVISDVETRLDSSGVPAVMLVDATVENRGLTSHRVPAVIVDVEASDGTSRQFRLSTRADDLAPGARHLFSGRIPALKNGIDSVKVKLGYGDDS